MNSKMLKELLGRDNIHCHISTSLKFDGKFYPRIPDTKTSGENSTINRICVGKSLEGVLTAIPEGGSRLDSYSESEYLFKLCLIDLEKLGIKDKDIVKSDYLYETGLVPDAHITGECWITTPFEISDEDMIVIKLKSWNEESHDLIPYHIEVIAESEYDYDAYEAYDDLVGGNVPCLTGITDVEFISEYLKKGDSFEVDEDVLEEYQLDSIRENYPSLLIESNYGHLEFTAEEDMNIKELLMIIYNNTFGYYE